MKYYFPTLYGIYSKIAQIFSPKGFVLLAEGFSPVLFFCLFALFILLTWPVWRWLWGEWWRNDYYSHGMLIVPIALYLAWRRMSNDKQERKQKGTLHPVGSQFK